MIDRYGRPADVIPQAAACGLCFPATVPSLLPPLLFAVTHVLLGPLCLCFLKHADNTDAGGTRLRCPLYSGHRNCSSSPFAAMKRMALGREDVCQSSWISGVAVWVSFRYRLGGRKLYLFEKFSLQIRTKACTSPRQIPLRFKCRLGAV